MKYTCAALLAALALLGRVHGETPEAGGVQFLTGDGRLSAGIDERGWLAYLRGPSPDQGCHAAPELDRSGPGLGGAGWLVREGDAWIPLASGAWAVQSDYTTPDALVLNTRFEARDSARKAEQMIFVWPGKDVLLVQLRLHGFPSDCRVAWYENFAPATGNVTGGAGEEWPVRPNRDFAAWYDVERAVLTHFRPRQPGRAAWRRARRLSRGDDVPGGWDAFGQGVYLSTRSPNATQGFAVGPAAISLPDNSGGVAAAGRVHARLELAPEVVGDALHFGVIVGIAASGSAARQKAQATALAGWPAALAAADALGAEWLRGAHAVPGDVAIHRDILNLLLCVDQASGGVRYAPASATSGAVATVFTSVWASAALDTLGYTDGAARALKLHLESVRPGGAKGQPEGSLPAALYCTGELARFDRAAEPASAAWLLAGCWRHAISLPDDARAPYLASVSPVLAQCADYLAREPGAGRALAGESSAPDVPLSALETHYLGLECWRRILDVLGGEETQMCADRKAELLTRIRIRRQSDGGGAEAVDPWIGGWLRALPGPASGASSGWEGFLGDPPPRQAAEEGDRASATPDALRDALRCLAGVRRLRAAPAD